MDIMLGTTYKFIILVTLYMYMTAAYPDLNGIIAWHWYSSKFQEGAALTITTVLILEHSCQVHVCFSCILKSFKLRISLKSKDIEYSTDQISGQCHAS